MKQALVLLCAVLPILALGFSMGSELSAQGDDDWAVGHWKGTLVAGPQQIPMVFHLASGDEGALEGTLDVQGITLPLTTVAVADGTLTMTFAVPGGGTYEGSRDDSGDVISGTFSQAGQSFPMELERSEADERPLRPQEPKAPYPYHVEDVTFPNESAGIELAGTITLPEGMGPFTGVVLVSGSGPQDRDEALMDHKPFHVLADYLTRQGIAVLRFDDRGVGASGGEFASATSEDFATDAVAATSFLANRAEVAEDRVGIIGHSEGGLIAPMAAGLTDGVAYTVLLAGPGVAGLDILREQQMLIARAGGAAPAIIELNARILDVLMEVMREESDPDAADPLMREAMRAEIDKLPTDVKEAAGDALGEPLIEQTVRQFNSAWFRFFLSYDPRPALEAVTVPVLAVFGEKDLQVPPAQSAPEIEAALERAGHADATVLVLPGLNHLFQEAETGSPTEYQQIEQTMSPAVLEAVSSWILQRFGPGTTISDR